MHAERHAERGVSARTLPVLPGPPGHEHLPQLAPQAAEHDVVNREGNPLSDGSLRAARAVAEALFSDEQGAPDPGRVDWVVDDFGRFFAAGPPRARSVMRLCLFALTWVAPFFAGRPGTPLASLSREERMHALDRMEASLFGPAALAPKAILCMLWLEHPDTQRETGTEPTCKRSR